MSVAVRPVFFATPADFRRWLEQHHDTARELWVGFYKRGSGRPSITWPESVDEALCFGWIDGVRKSLDAERYVIRFTPRKTDSIWSQVNLRKMKALIKAGRVRPAGLNAYNARDLKKSRRYSFEQRANPRLDPESLAKFKMNRAAWTFFESQPPGYRRVVTFWIVSAKRAETRERRLKTLMEHSAGGRRIDFMKPGA